MTQPYDPNADTPISVIEDLDPEPAPGRRGRFRLDLLVGVPLLLLVIGVALFQWWWQDYQSSQYRAGQEASGRNDLDGALHYFAEASGYKDADAIASGLREQIGERNRLYDAAVEFAGQDKWLHALQDIRAIARIQPGYKDIVEREDAALENVYTDALSGTIVQREGADPPGLYLRNSDGWVWLEGSDAHSSVIQVSENGYIFYDVPGKGVALPSPTPVGGEQYRIRNLLDENREIALAVPGKDRHYTFRNLGASIYEPSVAGKNGYWTFGNSSQSQDDESPMVQNPYWSSRTFLYRTYEGVGDSIETIEPTKPFTTGNRLLDFDRNSNHYLLAEWTGANTRGPIPGTVLNLYLCANGENTKQLIFTVHNGGLQSAQFSPDGRFVLVSAYTNTERADEPFFQVTTYIVDTQNGNKARELSTALTHNDVRFEPQQRVYATFVRMGVFAGKLLLINYVSGISNGEVANGVARIRLLDPEKVMTASEQENNRITASVQGIRASFVGLLQQDDDGLLILSIGTYDEKATPAYPAVLIKLDAGGETESYGPIEWINSGFIGSWKTTDDWIAWNQTVFDGTGIGGSSTQVVKLVERRTGGGQDLAATKPRTVYTARDEEEESDSVIDPHRVFFRTNLGEKLIGYTVDGNLHIHTYDDDLDVVLEAGVTAIWSLPTTVQNATLR